MKSAIDSTTESSSSNRVMTDYDIHSNKQKAERVERYSNSNQMKGLLGSNSNGNADAEILKVTNVPYKNLQNNEYYKEPNNTLRSKHMKNILSHSNAKR